MVISIKVFTLLLLFGSLGFVQSCDCGGNVSYSSQQNLNRRPNKKRKKSYKMNLTNKNPAKFIKPHTKKIVL